MTDSAKLLDAWLSRATSQVAAAKLRPMAEEVGRLESVADGVAFVSGLPNVRLDELLQFRNGIMGFPFPARLRSDILADGAADEDHRENGENIGLDGARQEVERHQRNRHQQACKREHDPDDKDAAHDIAKQAHRHRKGSGEGLRDVERDHQEGRLRKGLEIADEAARLHSVIDRREENDRRHGGIRLYMRGRRHDTGYERRPVGTENIEEQGPDQSPIRPRRRANCVGDLRIDRFNDHLQARLEARRRERQASRGG